MNSSDLQDYEQQAVRKPQPSQIEDGPSSDNERGGLTLGSDE